ncbi:MAG: N-6 DNA methylase [Bacteroidales bacterium]|nr:N-6 DNA methylase [Bacteroidales bacterium]
MSDFVQQNASTVDFESIGSDSWVILSPIEISIKRKIESVGVPLKDWDIKIYRGVLTGYNDAFIISTETREDILNNCASEEERKRTEELIRPILRGRDIKRYGYDWAGLYLIATFPSRHYNIEEYPAVKEYLLSFGMERLEQTGKEYIIDGQKVKARKKTNNKWFETQDSISYWDNFLDGVLEPLFFEVLNTDKPYRTAVAKSLPGIDNIPYLNGGLFARDEIDERTCVFPEDIFKRLFDFLDSYNFTIDENDTDDAEIGIDPEMLGRIFENLLEDNKDKGAFYTPKEIVDYMCRESIIAYLITGIPERSHKLIRNFVETLDASDLDEKQRSYIRKQLQTVKICDPAIGSGAFPMGLVNLLSKLYVAMKADTDTAKMKRHIMEQNIYGVDIEQGAVDIARLRFWLAMIVEEKEAIPLPNLHFKIMQGNSLLESYNGANLADLTKISGQSSLFDSDNSEREALISSLKSYYKTSDHAKRDKLFNDIINNVRRQLFDKGITLQAGKDPSANSDFFLWHTWFTDVFTSGGFDIVIGNPPYIQLQKSLGITAIDKKGKEYDMKLGDLYKDANFATFEKTGDIYCLFYELGNKMLKDGGHLCYITSNKWMRAGYGERLRSYLSKSTNPKILIDFGGIQIFDSATVDTNILLIQKAKNQKSTMAVTASKHDKTILNNLSHSSWP